ncbi:MAG: nitrile hydratase subunit beta [Rhodospirillales bacterium]|nr:nitrile hydratase subunit beta [Rhodospirillales bacterium]
MRGRFTPGGAGRPNERPGAKLAAGSINRGAFAPGAKVRIRAAFPPGHVRTPYFLRGKEGVIDCLAGEFPNPEELAYGRTGLPRLALYRVLFRQPDLWPAYAGAAADTVIADIFEHWLDEATERRPANPA